jgi:hypothetical protein
MSATSTTISSTNTVTRWHEFQTVRRNITRSTAAYSLVGFFLQIKDRHYGNTWSKAIRASHYSHRFWHHVWSSPGGNLGDPRPSFMKFVNFSTFLKVAFPIHFQISIFPSGFDVSRGPSLCLLSGWCPTPDSPAYGRRPSCSCSPVSCTWTTAKPPTSKPQSTLSARCYSTSLPEPKRQEIIWFEGLICFTCKLIEHIGFFLM